MCLRRGMLTLVRFKNLNCLIHCSIGHLTGMVWGDAAPALPPSARVPALSSQSSAGGALNRLDILAERLAPFDTGRPPPGASFPGRPPWCLSKGEGGVSNMPIPTLDTYGPELVSSYIEAHKSSEVHANTSVVNDDHATPALRSSWPYDFDFDWELLCCESAVSECLLASHNT